MAEVLDRLDLDEILDGAHGGASLAARIARHGGAAARIPAVHDLRSHERHVYSQGGEDGVIARIFARIGTRNRRFVEFGAWDGQHWSNTANLRLHAGWTGLLIDRDGARRNEALVVADTITAENVNEVFARHGVPHDLDLLSMDIDGNEYWVWQALRYRPRLVVVEYNMGFGLDVAKTIAYRHDHVWDETSYHGASLAALRKLGRRKGYSLIHTDGWVPNAFFVADEELPPELIDLPIERVAAWHQRGEPADSRHRAWVEV